MLPIGHQCSGFVNSSDAIFCADTTTIVAVVVVGVVVVVHIIVVGLVYLCRPRFRYVSPSSYVVCRPEFVPRK